MGMLPASDPRSDVVSGLGVRLSRRTRFEASGQWAFSYPGAPRLKLVALQRGSCWLQLPQRAPQRLGAGDVFLTCDTPYAIASDPALAPVDGTHFYASPGSHVARIGAADETLLVGGGIGFDSAGLAAPLGVLPTFEHLDAASAAARANARALAMLEAEVDHALRGSALIADRLAEILLVEALRSLGQERVGYLQALSDHAVGRALTLLHGELAHAWTVNELAARVGMSRSAFAARFTQRVGTPPLSYLAQLRLLTARRWLRDSRRSVAEVAQEVGYTSHSAFSQAYRRAFGSTPRTRQQT